ncbi:hypothetical protein AGMMS4957_10760 [Bacteroidia bacterium]|nr:hypothetical protein AGMMS4957_10760 [Bacteroidia bacterium]
MSYDIYSANELPACAFTNPSTFVGKASFVSVRLPAGLASIGKYAFYNCSGTASEFYTNNTPIDIAAGSTGNKTFIARWVNGCTVTFDTNGGSLIPSQTVLSGYPAGIYLLRVGKTSLKIIKR